jgi:hypothetical protein
MPNIPTDFETKTQTSGDDNPLIKKEQIDLPSDFYNDEDKKYLTYLQKRLEASKTMKETPLPEFNNKTYYQDYEENIKIANTKLPEKKNEDDVVVSAGTVEAKLEALLSHVNGLELSPEVLAFDRENNMINDLGIALTDTIFMTEQIDGGEVAGDEEKKMLRQRELLMQNAVFIQEEWLRRFEMRKKLKEKYNGQFKNWKEWDGALEMVFEGPSRTLLHGPNVYLGDITEYFMERQPFVFAAFQQDYNIAKTKYGKFENWQYVKAGAIPSGTTDEHKTIYDNKWRLNEVKQNHVEIILYQDKPNDEFQILINGMPMLPIGFPLSAVSPMGEYNIVKQVLKPKHAKFAYGTAFVASGSIKEISALIDEMLKLFVLKTRKSISVPYVNTSGRVISKRVLSPGRISMGFSADSLQPIGTEGQGVTANEYNILKELQDRIDKSTISNQFAGQQGKSGTTATEVLELQRQAKLTLGLTIAACVLMEKKLGYLRLWNIIENWFNPIDTKVVTVNDVRKSINSYRKTVRQTNVDGAGMGERQIIPFDAMDESGNMDLSKMPSPDVVRQMEFDEEAQRGVPVQKIFLSPQGLKVARIRWYLVINPKEKEGTAFFKVLFREQLSDMLLLMQLGSVPNRDGLEEEFSRVWGKSRNKLFAAPSQMSPEMAGVSSATQGRTNQTGVPNLAALSAVAPGGTSE